MNVYLPYDKEKALREYSNKTQKSISKILSDLIDRLAGPISQESQNKEDTNLYSEPIDVKEQIKKGNTNLNNHLDRVKSTEADKPFCQKQFCRNKSEGLYRVVSMDAENTEQKLELCTFHWHQARKEANVYEV